MRIPKKSFCVLLLLAIAFVTPAHAEDMRLELRIGGAYGGGSGSGNGGDGEWKIQNAGTGLGLATGVQFWMDHISDNDLLSVGLEYEYNHFHSKFTSSDGSARKFDGELHLNSFMLNLSARKTEGSFSPYIGGGLGVVYYHGRANDTWSFASGSNGGLAPMIQIIAGVDYDLSDRYYTGFETKFGYFSASPLGADISYHKLDTMLKFGIKF